MEIKRSQIDDLVIGERDECWRWNRKLKMIGYVYLPTGRRGPEAPGHRVVAEIVFGDLAGRHVHHTCGNKACGNPSHFQLLTKSEHHRMHANQSKCKHGDDFRLTRKNGRTYCAECQRVRNKLWYHEQGGREWFQRRNKVT